MWIDLFLLILVECLKSIGKILAASLHISWCSRVVWKVVGDRRSRNLVFEYCVYIFMLVDVHIDKQKRLLALQSILFKKRIMLVRMNHRELQMESKRARDSCIRLILSSSYSDWSYSDMATRNTMAVTFSKQWIHFFRSLRWPPTSNSL